MADKSRRGLASADQKTREEVGRKGGQAYHRIRGLKAADPQTRARVASLGGKAHRRK